MSSSHSLPQDDSRSSKRVRRILFASSDDETESDESVQTPKKRCHDASFREERLRYESILKEQDVELTKTKDEIRDLNAKLSDALGDLEVERANRMCFEEDIGSLEHELGAFEAEHSDLKKEINKWVRKTLKFHYLCEQMERVGLSSSEDIFDMYHDIKIPEQVRGSEEIFQRLKANAVGAPDNIEYTNYQEDLEHYGADLGPRVGEEDEEPEQGADQGTVLIFTDQGTEIDDLEPDLEDNATEEIVEAIPVEVVSEETTDIVIIPTPEAHEIEHITITLPSEDHHHCAVAHCSEKIDAAITIQNAWRSCRFFISRNPE